MFAAYATSELLYYPWTSEPAGTQLLSCKGARGISWEEGKAPLIAPRQGCTKEMLTKARLLGPSVPCLNGVLHKQSICNGLRTSTANPENNNHVPVFTSLKSGDICSVNHRCKDLGWCQIVPGTEVISDLGPLCVHHTHTNTPTCNESASSNWSYQIWCRFRYQILVQL